MTNLRRILTTATLTVAAFSGTALIAGCTGPAPVTVTPPPGASASSATTLPSPTTTAPVYTPRTASTPTTTSSVGVPEPPGPDPTTTPPSRPTSTSATTLSATANPPPLTAPDVTNLQAQVVSVYDGDTLTVVIEGEKESVRPLGMDAPEKDNPNIGVKGECYAEQSADALRALIDGEQVTLTVDPEQGNADDDYRDQYGRLLRYVEIGDIDISQYQIVNGNAWVYEQYPVARTPIYQIAMTQAQDNHNGLWAACE